MKMFLVRKKQALCNEKIQKKRSVTFPDNYIIFFYLFLSFYIIKTFLTHCSDSCNLVLYLIQAGGNVLSPAGTRKPLQEQGSITASDASSTTNEIDNLLKDFDLPSSVSSGKPTSGMLCQVPQDL